METTVNERIGLVSRATGMVESIIKVEQVQCLTCYSHISYCTCKPSTYNMEYLDKALDKIDHDRRVIQMEQVQSLKRAIEHE